MFANANDLRKNVCFSDVCLHSRKMLQKIFYIVCLEQRKTNPPLPATQTHPATHPCHPPQPTPLPTTINKKNPPTTTATQSQTNPQPPQPTTPQPTANHETHNHRNKSPQPTFQNPPRTSSHPPEIKPQTKIHFRRERARSTRGFGCARSTREGGVGLCKIDERG